MHPQTQNASSPSTTMNAMPLHPIVSSILSAIRPEGAATRLGVEEFKQARGLVHGRQEDRVLALHLWVAHNQLAESGAPKAAAQLLELATVCFRDITTDAAHLAAEKARAKASPRRGTDPLAPTNGGMRLRSPVRIGSIR